MPKMKWTAKDIPTKARAMQGERTFWTFEGVQGLLLECHVNGERHWKCRYKVYIGGKRVERKLHLGRLAPEDLRALSYVVQSSVLTPGQARDKTIAILAQVGSGEDPWLAQHDAKVTPAGETLATLWDDYVVRRLRVGASKSASEREGLWRRHLSARLGGKVASKVTRLEISQALHDIADTVSALQANHCKRALSACLTWSASAGRIDAHPMTGMEDIQSEEVRAPRRALTTEEIRKVWISLDALPEVLGDAIRVLALTGQRRGEISRVTRDEIVVEGNVTLWRPPAIKLKNGQKHELPLAPTASAIIERRMNSTKGKFLFPAAFRRDGGEDEAAVHTTTLSKAFQQMAQAAGISGVTLHGLRHTFKTWAADHDVPDKVSDLITNHKQNKRDRGAAAGYDHARMRAQCLAALTQYEAWVMAPARSAIAEADEVMGPLSISGEAPSFLDLL